MAAHGAKKVHHRKSALSRHLVPISFLVIAVVCAGILLLYNRPPDGKPADPPTATAPSK